MNHREPPQLPAGVSKALHCLLLVLLPVVAIDNASALPRTRLPGSGPDTPRTGAIPYLSAIGAPPLRFQSPAPEPASTFPSTATAPSTLQSAVENPGAEPDEIPAALNTSPISAVPSSTSTDESSANDPAKAPAKVTQPILRDSLTPTVRPEDFLPYFQIPGSAQHPSDVTLLVPAANSAPVPAAIPPSSATYRQTP